MIEGTNDFLNYLARCACGWSDKKGILVSLFLMVGWNERKAKGKEKRKEKKENKQQKKRASQWIYQGKKNLSPSIVVIRR